jgi:hypothetical protein
MQPGFKEKTSLKAAAQEQTIRKNNGGNQYEF